MVELDDGSLEYYGADGQLQHTECPNTKGTHPSPLPSSGQSITGPQQQQHQQRPQQQQHQSMLGKTHSPPDNNSIPDVGPDGSTFVDTSANQGDYVGQDRNIFADQNPDINMAQSFIPTRQANMVGSNQGTMGFNQDMMRFNQNLMALNNLNQNISTFTQGTMMPQNERLAE